MASIKPHAQPDKVPPEPHFGRGGPVVVVANPQAIAALQAAPDLAALGKLSCHAVGATDPVPDAWLTGAGVLVIEAVVDQPASLERIALIHRQHPELPLVAALATASVALSRGLLRQGVTDIATLPIDCTGLAMQLRDLSDGEYERRSGRTGQLIVVAGSTGGCGATTILTHLAASLGGTDADRPRVCAIDLDLQAGEVVHFIGQVPRVTVSPLLDAGDRLDTELVRSTLTDSQHGFAVIAAPETITSLDDVDQDRLLEMVGLVRSMFDVVLADVPTDWSNWSLSLALAADRVVLVTELTVAGLRQARRRLDLFASVGMNPDRVTVVGNRVERGLFKPIGVKEAAQVLGHPIAVAFPDEEDELVAAQNEGRLLTDLHRHSRFASAVQALAQSLDLEGR